MKGKKIITVSLITLVAICLITTGISAANLIGADSVQYKDTTVKAALDELMDKANKNSIGTLRLRAKIGDYVRMTPTSTSYKVSRDLTGYNSDQTINPSELNLWRVISLNEDGTIDMVSEYVSSTKVYFFGKTGYLNFVGALNTIAKQYENSNYTIGSRHMGYNGQTEYITDNSNEAVGGGDTLYVKDTTLVTTALRTLVAEVVGLPYDTEYWLASRCYNCGSFNGYSWSGRYVNYSDSVDYGLLYHEGSSYFDDYALRPIVTLRSDVSETSGSGTSADPWVLQ